MNEKKSNRTVVVGTVIICVTLLLGLVGVAINYNSLLDAKDSIIANQDLQIVDKDFHINATQVTVDEKQSEIDGLNSQIAQLNSTVSSLNEQLSRKNSEIASLNSQISSLTSQVAILNSQILQDNSTIASLTDQISLLEYITNSLTLEVSALNSQISSLNSQITSLQAQNDGLTSEIAALNSEMENLQLAYANYVVAYKNLRAIVNQRCTHTGISDFITPEDSAVFSAVYSVTGGWSDTSDLSEFWADVKELYTWIRGNIEYRYDGLSPVLPFDPADDLYYGGDMWQFPNETLGLEKGDCEDQAILLCSMIRCYSNMNYDVHCVWITGSKSAHVGVQIPVSGDRLVIFDPAGDYYSRDLFGNIVYNDIASEINNWFDYWESVIGSDIRVYRVFS